MLPHLVGRVPGHELPGGPPPLRNEAYPWGFDDLTPEQSARVEAANKIYRGLAIFVELLISLGIYFAIENPANSLLWLLPIWDKILERAFFVTFDACVYGGSRNTAKTFLTNVPTLKAMAQRCNGGHSHLPFGRQRLPSGRYAYATAEEAAYPRPLCLQIVAQVCAALNIEITQMMAASVPTKAFAGSARLPRGRKVPPLVSEFERIAKVILNELPQVNSKRCLLHSLHDIPAGSKFLSHIFLSGEDDDDATRRYQWTFGVYYTKEAFLEKAMSVVHPFDSMCPVKDELLKMLFDIVTNGPFWVVEQRQLTLKRWLGYANELREQEKTLRNTLQSDVDAVLKGKRLLLLEKLANEVGWADKEIFNLMRNGFSLVGNAGYHSTFHEMLHRPRKMTLELHQILRLPRKMTLMIDPRYI